MNSLRKARTDAGLTLQQLSDKSGVAVETLSRLENDEHKPQARTLKKIADALGLSVSELSQALNRVEVLVGFFDREDIFRGQRLNFRGEKIRAVELAGGDRTLTLYKGPNGYRVHEVDFPDGALYPKQKNADTGEIEYSTYASAEEVAEAFPELADVVGIYPVRYID